MDSTAFVTVLDTDIGSDIDDALALTLMARRPELNLIGVTTVYGDTLLRARMVRFILDRLDRPDVVVVPGEQATLADRPVWMSGQEGEGMPLLDQVPVDAEGGGGAYLCETARKHAGKLDVFAIGPLTNIARAIQADPHFAGSVRHMYVMGGAYWMDRPEHNIKCDPEAAAVVFGSGIPMTVCGLDVTTRVWLRPSDIELLDTSLGDVGQVLARQARQWIDYLADNGASTAVASATNLHDPLAVLAALRSDLFDFVECDVDVDMSDEIPGTTHPSNCGNGSIRLARDVDVSAAERELMRLIAGARNG